MSSFVSISISEMLVCENMYIIIEIYYFLECHKNLNNKDGVILNLEF